MGKQGLLKVCTDPSVPKKYIKISHGVVSVDAFSPKWIFVLSLVKSQNSFWVHYTCFKGLVKMYFSC